MSLSRPEAELTAVAWVSHCQEGNDPFQAGSLRERIGQFLIGGDAKSIVKTSKDRLPLVTPLAHGRNGGKTIFLRKKGFLRLLHMRKQLLNQEQY